MICCERYSPAEGTALHRAYSICGMDPLKSGLSLYNLKFLGGMKLTWLTFQPLFSGLTAGS